MQMQYRAAFPSFLLLLPLTATGESASSSSGCARVDRAAAAVSRE